MIVVGARCAGSPTAMLLAAAGYRVLVVDRATFPSDTISTHVVHPPGVAALAAVGPARPGGRDGMPADRHVRVRLRPVHDRRAARDRRRRRSRTARGAPCSTSCWSTPRPRREPRSGRGSPSRRSSIDDGRVTGIRGHAKDGATVTERARVVVGADGLHSLVARAVRPEPVPREAAAAVRLLHLLERPADGRPLRDLHPRRPRIRGARPPTTT